MTCFQPQAIKPPAKVVNLEGFATMLVPCGGCLGCLVDRARQWAVRGMHEAALHEQNCFVTLTYEEEQLPPGGSLDRRAFPLFMKRLRKARGGTDVRYLHAGEYGGRLGRPHYHAALFGVGFPDQSPWAMRKGRQAFRSAELERLWPFGHCEVEQLTFGAVAYVAQYVLKKRTRKGTLACDRATGEVWPVEPEYATMSRRPALGKRWFERFHQEVYVHDSVLVEGREVKPPRYYDRLLAELDPDRHAAVCSERMRRGSRPEAMYERSRERLAVKEQIAKAHVKERSLE